MTLPRSRIRPNFFLGFQIYNVDIHKKVKKLQQKVIETNPSLHPALIDISTLHVTLAVTHLANEKDIQIMKSTLDDWADQHLNVFFKDPMILSFTGVKTFKDEVAYVDVEQCQNYDNLLKLAQSINDLLSSVGFFISNKSFNPHLTILKLSKDFKLIKLKKKFKKDFDYLKEQTDHFGKQGISHIQLLSMDKPKDSSGYYQCFHQINVSNIPCFGDHSECCTSIPIPEEKS